MLESTYRTSRLLKALGNPARYMIIKELSREQLTPSQLAIRLHRSPDNVSQHLMILRALDVVRFKTQGGNVLYRIKARDVPDLLRMAEKCAARLPEMK